MTGGSTDPPASPGLSALLWGLPSAGPAAPTWTRRSCPGGRRGAQVSRRARGQGRLPPTAGDRGRDAGLGPSVSRRRDVCARPAGSRPLASAPGAALTLILTPCALRSLRRASQASSRARLSCSCRRRASPAASPAASAKRRTVCRKRTSSSTTLCRAAGLPAPAARCGHTAGRPAVTSGGGLAMPSTEQELQRPRARRLRPAATPLAPPRCPDGDLRGSGGAGALRAGGGGGGGNPGLPATAGGGRVPRPSMREPSLPRAPRLRGETAGPGLVPDRPGRPVREAGTRQRDRPRRVRPAPRPPASLESEDSDRFNHRPHRREGVVRAGRPWNVPDGGAADSSGWTHRRPG